MPIYNNLTGLYESDLSVGSDMYTQKAAKLADRTAEKQTKLNPTTQLQQDLLLGMNDADSLITQRFGGNTRSASKPNDFYDAVEIGHRTHYDPITKAYVVDDDPQAAANANPYKALKQAAQVSLITGKDQSELTKQDYIDVGNMQQIQKLSDLGWDSSKDPRWVAPYIQGVEQTNLTGRTIDEYGNVIQAPLNLNIGTRFLGEMASTKKGSTKPDRPLVDFTNMNGTDITALHSNDPRMNANYVAPANFDEPATTNRLLSAAASIPASFAGGVTDIADALTDMGLWAGQKVADAAGIEDVSAKVLDTWDITRRKDGSLDSHLFEEGKKVFDNMLGVDSSRIQTEQKAFTDDVKVALANDKLSNTDKIAEVGKIVADHYEIIPEAIGASLGYLGTLFLGAGAKVATVTSGGKAEAALSFLNQTSNLSKAQQAARVAEATKASGGVATALQTQKALEGAKAITLEGIPAALSQANQTLEARRKNNDGEAAGVLEALNILATSYGYVKTDQIVDKSIILQTSKVTEQIAKAVPDIIKSGSKVEAQSALAGMAKSIGALGVNTAFDSVKEGFTEGFQEALALYGERFGTKDFGDKEWLGIGDDASMDRLIDNAALGALTGGGQSAGGQIVGGAYNAIDNKVKSKIDAENDVLNKPTAFDTAITNNPNLSKEDLQAHLDILQRAKLDTEDNSEVGPINRDAYIAAMEAENASIDSVYNTDAVNEEQRNPEKFANIQAKATDFDSAYNEAITETKRFAEANKNVEVQEGSTDQYKVFMAQEAIPVMQQMMQDVIDAGAGPNKQKTMVDKINNLVTLANSTTIKELDSLVDTKLDSTSAKNAVSAVIGSSAASTAHIDKILGSSDVSLSPIERKALEIKRKALKAPSAKPTKGKSIHEVSKQKLIGGGTKPGVMQWVALLSNGNKASIAQSLEKIKEFVSGQDAKLAEYKAALDEFDEANGIDVTASYNTRASDRAVDKDGVRLSTAPITLPGGVEYKANALSSVIQAMEAEQGQLNELAELASKVTPESASKTNDKVPTSDEVVVEDKEAAKEEKAPTKAPSKASISQATDTRLAAWRTQASAERDKLGKQVADGEITAEDAAERERKINTFDDKVIAEQAKRNTKSSVPKQEEVVAEDTKTAEIMAVAKDSESKYNVGTKEAVLHLLTTNKLIKALLADNNIDLKDC